MLHIPGDSLLEQSLKASLLYPENAAQEAEAVFRCSLLILASFPGASNVDDLGLAQKARCKAF